MVDSDEDLGRAVGELAAGGGDRRGLAHVARLARSSMKTAGARSLATGKWLADVLVDTAPHIPVRDLRTLQDHHHGLTGDRLASELIRAASLTTAAIGAVAGAVAGAEELAPPTWLAIPGELLVETLAVVAVELKLVAELQEVYGRPLQGSTTDKSLAVVRAWAEGRGVTAQTFTEPGGLGSAFGRSTRRELTRLLQRRLARRALRNSSALSPFLTGAVAAAELNRRATRSLGDKVARDLGRRA